MPEEPRTSKEEKEEPKKVKDFDLLDCYLNLSFYFYSVEDCNVRSFFRIHFFLIKSYQCNLIKNI
jgi:hypothetical protein